MQAITALDNILSDHTKAAKNIPSSSGVILNQLINNELEHKIDPFIYKSFKLFMDKKTDITLNMDSMIDVNAGFLTLIFGETGCEKYTLDNYTGSDIDSDCPESALGRSHHDYFIPSDGTNIPLVLNHFSNIETIKIINTQNEDGEYYSLSLFSLLMLLQPQSVVKHIEIKIHEVSVGPRMIMDLQDSWISFMCNDTDISALQQKYENKGYNIQCQLNNKDHAYDTIVIKKL